MASLHTRKAPAMMMVVSFIILLVCLLLASSANGFAPQFSPVATTHTRVISGTSTNSRNNFGRNSRLSMATVEVKTPSQEEAETMGIREWPQQAKSKGSFVESSKEGQTLVRYVLDGQGSVEIQDSDDQSQTISMKPGSLLEVTGEATLSWDVTTKEMILLTPGFEQMGIFAGVALALVVLLGALVATS